MVAVVQAVQRFSIWAQEFDTGKATLRGFRKTYTEAVKLRDFYFGQSIIVRAWIDDAEDNHTPPVLRDKEPTHLGNANNA